MDYLPVSVVLLSMWTVISSHPHTAPTVVCPTTTQIAQCQATNNFASSFHLATDPKSWTAGDIDIVCTNKEEYIAYHTCLLSAEKSCVGTASENLVLDSSVINSFYQFICQEKAHVPGTCITTNKVAIETCYNNAVATITTSTTDYQCSRMDELEKCYQLNWATCTQHTKNVVDIILYKLRPVKCGCDVIKASFGLLVLAAIFAVRTAGFSS